jgi:hypothetical protein
MNMLRGASRLMCLHAPSPHVRGIHPTHQIDEGYGICRVHQIRTGLSQLGALDTNHGVIVRDQQVWVSISGKFPWPTAGRQGDQSQPLDQDRVNNTDERHEGSFGRATICGANVCSSARFRKSLVSGPRRRSKPPKPSSSHHQISHLGNQASAS